MRFAIRLLPDPVEDGQTTDGTVGVVSEGHWRLFTPDPGASGPGASA
jgi:hypothetical protein